MDENTIIYIVSDSAGETAELVVKAAANQFTEKNIELHRIAYVEDQGTINEVIMQAKETNGLIAFTLVVPEIRDYLKGQAKKMNIPTYDILSPMMNMLEERFRSAPRNEPGVMHMLDDDYYRKVEAIEFAVKYDDGRDPRGILRADLVLIGVSRTSKTPLSQYLAHKRLKVANVPLVPEVDPPKELFQISQEKIFGLTINPEKLNSIRTERLKSLGLKAEANYANFDRIKEELAHSDQVMNKLGCEVVDVSNRAVEETANLIYQMNLKFKENE